MRTLILGQTLQVYLDGKVVTVLWLDNIWPILALQDSLRPVLD